MDIKSILGNWIVKNVILYAVLVCLMAFVVTICLNIGTKHGQEVAVPDFTNRTVAEAESMATGAGVTVLVTDSIYMNRAAKGAVLSQLPKAGSRVKEGRKVSLTINSSIPKKVRMPSLVGTSMRQAKAELSSKGLILGNLRYVSDIATNNVLRQLYRGRDIVPGKEIPSGSTIDLVLGLNSTEGRAYIPNLKGLKYLTAIDALHENSLNVNSIRFDSTVKTYSDSLSAAVYAQRPEATGDPVMMGTGVTIMLTIDENKLGTSK